MINIRVPATSANLGPGFDTLGIALDLYNEFQFEEADWSDNNMVLSAYRSFFQEINQPPPPVRLAINSSIPSSRGLGSSASCIVAGVLAAHHFSGKQLPMEELLRIATLIEGHPDNVAPALLGGLVLSARTDQLTWTSIPLGMELEFLAMIPNFTLSTKKAREVIPQQFSKEDSLFNLSALSLLITSLIKGDAPLLHRAMQDRLHQPYRRSLIRDYDVIEELLRERALGFYLSGAGPTLMAVSQDAKALQEVLEEHWDPLKERWQMKILHVDMMGARMEKP